MRPRLLVSGGLGVAAVLGLLTVGCSGRRGLVRPPVPGGWSVYEDDRFRFAYPPGSEVVGALNGIQDPAFPSFAVIPPPHAQVSVLGGLHIQPDPGERGKPLSERLDAVLNRNPEARFVLKAPWESVAGGGRCRAALTASPSQSCPKGEACYTPLYDLVCDDAQGAPYLGGAVLSPGPEMEGLSAAAKQEAALIEAILASFEFKRATGPVGWLSYEDDRFKAEYPPGSVLDGPSEGHQDPRNVYLSITPPNGGRGATAGLHIAPAGAAHDGPLLEAVAAAAGRYLGEAGHIVSETQVIVVGNGRCALTLILTPADYCPRDMNPCFSPLSVGRCDGPDGVRYQVETGFSFGPRKDALSPQARQEAAVYERILRSLEFKKS